MKKKCKTSESISPSSSVSCEPYPETVPSEPIPDEYSKIIAVKLVRSVKIRGNVYGVGTIFDVEFPNRLTSNSFDVCTGHGTYHSLYFHDDIEPIYGEEI